MAAAVAQRARPLVVRGRRQRVVPPLAADGVRSGQHLAVDDDARAGAGAEDHAKHDAPRRRLRRQPLPDNAKQLASLASRIGRAEHPREIVGQRTADQPRRVRVLDDSRSRATPRQESQCLP